MTSGSNIANHGEAFFASYPAFATLQVAFFGLVGSDGSHTVGHLAGRKPR